MLDTLGLGTGVIVAVAFEQVDASPDTETGADSYHKGLKNSNCIVKKVHILPPYKKAAFPGSPNCFISDPESVCFIISELKEGFTPDCCYSGA